MKAKLTIVIPLYNAKPYIEECLKSIQNQTYKDIKIIVVNDGSTDGSEVVAEWIAREDSRIKMIHQTNKGSSQARKAGVEICETEYITFVDADDFITEKAYINAVDYMEQHIDMIAFEIARFYDYNNIKREHHIIESGFYDRNRIKKDVFPNLLWDFGNDKPGFECSLDVKIVKTELLRNAYRRKKIDFHYGEDMAIVYPVLFNISTLQIVNECYYMHRQRKSGYPLYLLSDNCFDQCYLLYQLLIEELCEKYDIYGFRRQIEFLYVYLLSLKNDIYREKKLNERFLFPFDKVPYNKRILLYGAGEKGKVYYSQLTKLSYFDELLWVDRNAKFINDENVQEVEKINGWHCDFAIIAIDNNEICQDVKKILLQKNIEEDCIIY